MELGGVIAPLTYRDAFSPLLSDSRFRHLRCFPGTDSAAGSALSCTCGSTGDSGATLLGLTVLPKLHIPGVDRSNRSIVQKSLVMPAPYELIRKTSFQQYLLQSKNCLLTCSSS